MRKILSLSFILACLFSLTACVTTPKGDNASIEKLPAHRDDAARVLAAIKDEPWLALQQDATTHDILFLNPRRVFTYADGVSEIWLKLVFDQPVADSAMNAPVVATLMHVQVRCSDSVYRTDAWYALSPEGIVLDSVAGDYSSFEPLGIDAVALSISSAACRHVK